MILTNLPTEVLHTITSWLDQKTLKRLRLSCKFLHEIVTPACFRVVRLDLGGPSLSRLHGLARHDRLRLLPRTLVLGRQPNLPIYPDFTIWEESICFTSSSDTATDDGIEEWEDDRADLMSQDAWDALGLEEKEKLYHEYETERLHLRQKEIEALKCLYFRAAGRKRVVERVNPLDLTTDISMDSMFKELDETIAMLARLDTFEHEFGALDDSWGLRWRNLRFSPDNIIVHAVTEDFCLESLQLSYILRSLGHSNKSGHGFSCIKFHTEGPGFWSPSRMQHLWEAPGEEQSETLLDEEEEDMLLYSGYRDLSRRELYLRQIHIMEFAFLGLSRLDCTVSQDKRPLAIAGRYLLGFLRSAENLEQARLVFGDLSWWGELSLIDRQYCQGDAGTRLLAELTKCAPWPKIREIELELAVDGLTLIEFLCSLRPTLRHLQLTHVCLAPSAYSWEEVLLQIADSLNLESLGLEGLADYTPDVRTLLDGRIRDPSEDYLHSARHKDAVIRGLLERPARLLPLQR